MSTPSHNYQDLKTFSDFLDFADQLWDDNTERKLDVYLLALWGLIQKHANDQVDFALFGRLIVDAFTAEPARFEPGWLQLDEVYSLDPKFDDLPNSRNNLSAYEYLRFTIQRQIADLYEMQNRIEKATPVELYAGIGDWYNFTIQDYLRQGANGIRDHLKSPASKLRWSPDPRCLLSTNCDWDDLAEFLTMGQIYE